MARKVFTPTSPEQRRAQAQGLQASITAQVARLHDTDAWLGFCQAASRFHTYSWRNILLILHQNPNATQVAGFRAWQKMGRQVRRGEHGIKIFGIADKKIPLPAASTVVDGQEDADQDDRVQRVTYFPILTVFDISQTDPIPGADPLPEIAHQLTGDDELGILAAVTDWLASIGWTLTRESIPGQVNGFTAIDGTRRVVVDDRLAPAMAAKTALHEAGHVLLHTNQPAGDYATHRGVQETEAESVAYIVAGVLGLDTSAYTIGYIAGWSDCDTEVIQRTAERVLDAADRIIDAISQPAGDLVDA